MCVCVSVCVCERERDRETKRGSGTEESSPPGDPLQPRCCLGLTGPDKAC